MEGLNKQEIEYRINNGLVNNEVIKNSRDYKTIFLSNLITLFNLIHTVLFTLVLTTGSIKNATFVISIFFNTVISIYQEIKAKKIIDKLTITNTLKVKVIREGKQIEINPNEILLDDLLYLKQGDSLVVDAEIVKAECCEVDESIITGESDAIIKKTGEKLISGSIITAGKAYAKVISINRETYANNLIKEASKTVDESSYLMKNINAILKVVTVLIIPIGILLFVTQFNNGQSYSESILSSVAGIVGMIPDGLVLLTSISLTVGVIKMASKKVIIQKLSGIELLSCVDVLCLDKTGTITDGTMEVKDVIKIDKKIDFNNIMANLIDEDGNATDKALFKYFSKKNDMEVVKKTSFSSSRKYSMVEFLNGTYAIGALEYLSDRSLSDYSELDKYVNLGYRIITLVSCKTKFDKRTNKILGFIILKDNIRKNAKKTLDYFQEQDVKVKIISGDNPVTVSNILKQLSISGYDRYISGDKLPSEYDKLVEIVDDYLIFGRVTPYQKQNIIKALREKSTVGMIGDGVNDILALKEADCGIALASGISAARSVSEVVLTDSDFGCLPSIVNEGRRVVNNIERVASMFFIKTIYSFLISLICIILGHEYPFYPVQLTLISIVCVGIPSFFLAIEPNYKKVEKHFLIRVFRNALPSGLCVSINILFLIMFTNICNLDFEPFRLVVVAVTGYLNLRLLYGVCNKDKLLNKILIWGCSIVFYILLFTLGDFLLIKSYSFLSLILIILMIISSSLITELFENIYDKISYKYLNKRSRK